MLLSLSMEGYEKDVEWFGMGLKELLFLLLGTGVEEFLRQIENILCAHSLYSIILETSF